MSYEATILADTVSPAGVRLTTFQLCMPRFILAEFNTHRVLSRNAASSRAIPVRRRTLDIRARPVFPVEWGANKRGMQASGVLDAETEYKASTIWGDILDASVVAAEKLDALDPPVHKQVANRVCETYAWVPVVATATEWGSVFAQRAHPDAQPEFRVLAEMMLEAYRASESTERRHHLPYVDDAAAAWASDWDGPSYISSSVEKISTGRCARVSYKTFDGRTDPLDDIRLHDDLAAASPPHASPFEHPCVALDDPDVWCGNVRGFCQYRHRRLGGRHMKQVA